jgi:hypothetical protein
VRWRALIMELAYQGQCRTSSGMRSVFKSMTGVSSECIPSGVLDMWQCDEYQGPTWACHVHLLHTGGVAGEQRPVLDTLNALDHGG